MAELVLNFDPLPAGGVSDSAEAATWGSLSIEIERAPEHRTNLTEVLDLRVNGLRQRVDGSVLPLAEWLVRNWFVIFHSRRLPPDELTPRRTAYRWRRSHGLRFVGEGCALPDLQIFRGSEHCVDLAWRRDRSDEDSPSPVRFTADDGAVSVARDSVEATLIAFVDSIVRRCREYAGQSIRTTELSAAWDRVRRSNPLDQRAATLAARFDEPLERLDESMRQQLSKLKVAHPVAEALADLSNADDADGFATNLALASNSLVESKPAPKKLVRLRDRLRPSDSKDAWTRGWSDARALREALGFAHDRAAPPIAGLATEIPDVVADRLQRSEAIVAWNADSRPVVFASGRDKFQRHRNLWPVLFGGELSEPHAYPLSRGVWGPTSVANAFATELVAPVERVKDALATRTNVLTSEVEIIAGAMRAPFQCVLHQIENHRLAAVVRDRD